MMSNMSDTGQNPLSALQIGDLRVAVTSDAAPERNGVGAYYEDLLSYLSPRLAKAEVFSPVISDGRWEAPMVLPMPGDATQKLCFPNPFALQRALTDLNPHVLIVPTPGGYGFTGAYVAARKGIPMLTGLHTSFEQLTDLYWHGSLKGKFFRQYLERTHQYLFNRSSAVLTNSQDMYQLAVRMGAPNIEMIGTPIPRLFTQTPVVPYEGRLERVLFAGRLAAEKRIDTILDAARALPHLSFSIAGDGPLRSNVENAADTLANVNYLGWLDRQDLCRYVDGHDALVLPSHFESFGTIALEAMARNRVVIVSKGTGISNWTDLSRGFVTLGDNTDLTSTLKQLSEAESDWRKALAGRALESATTFNNENLTSWERILLKTTNQPRP
ncbi:MAG: glycosyl transferase family 1 [Gammaproteobacteria bacterium]|uniref:Glycosyl transferase family 1 n=1 Tax=OM182 bacterium MED-G24 TaxID=1986255 RepID=A0A2A5WTT1_9GAMM|nr:glycosyl transferase family 1 [Gammaproteobacteria bacterium]PDH39536.1 MAG: glycosyl transferase family 1 [OM182 bacterium MED-G24]RPG26541.1 MAG: glycosyltransferase [Gammaproteobacteria bacterium TMED50]